MKYLLTNEETNRLQFRSVSISDFEYWIEFFKDPKSFQHWIGERKNFEVECEEWYQKQFNRYKLNRGGMNALIEKSSGQLIGHAGLLVQMVDNTEELEVAYSLLPEFRNKGYATEAATKCRDFAFENNLADSVISIISITNTLSSNVASKNGMKSEKQTVYNENKVDIFRIKKRDWMRNSASV